MNKRAHMHPVAFYSSPMLNENTSGCLWGCKMQRRIHVSHFLTPHTRVSSKPALGYTAKTRRVSVGLVGVSNSILERLFMNLICNQACKLSQTNLEF